MNKTFGYTRVSTAKQTTESQLELLHQAGGEEIFVETGSGANRTRPELEKLLLMLRAGDTVVMVKLDRLARSLTDLLSLVKEIESQGAQLRSLHDPLIDTTTPNGKLIFGIFAFLAEYERELIRSRTLDGLAPARARGKHLGRKEALNQEQKESLRQLRENGQSFRQLAHTFNVSKTTIIRYLRLAKL